MSHDDYWDIVDDCKRYDNQRHDQELFEQDLSRRSRDVYDALEEGDRDKLNWIFQIPAHGDDQIQEHSNYTEIEQVSLETELSSLMSLIEKSELIPERLNFPWVNFLDSISYLEPPQARQHIEHFNQVFRQWKQVNRPVEDIWDIGDTRIWLFDCEVEQIQDKVDKIINLLDSN